MAWGACEAGNGCHRRQSGTKYGNFTLWENLCCADFRCAHRLIPYTYTEDMTDRLYCDAVMLGAKAADLAFYGILKAENFYEPLEAIRENGGWGIPTLKPWAVDVVKKRLKEVEAVHPFAFDMDIDSAGLPHAGLANPPMLLKTEEELREIAAATDLPFIVKGIMTAEAAQKAVRAGAYAIVVSNHGGRPMDRGSSRGAA